MRGRGNRERYQVQCFLFIAVVGKIAETLDLRIRPDDLAGFDAFRQLPFELGRNARVTGIAPVDVPLRIRLQRSEEHTSELQSLMRISYAVFCLKKKKTKYIMTKQRCSHKREYATSTNRRN